jgi:hypothetical protein
MPGFSRFRGQLPAHPEVKITGILTDVIKTEFFCLCGNSHAILLNAPGGYDAFMLQPRRVAAYER